MKQLLLVICLLSAAPAFAVDCHINEYTRMARDSTGDSIPVATEPKIATQNVTFTTTAVASATFNESTTFVRIICTSKTFFEFGTAPVATITDSYLAADTAEYFGCPQSGLRVSFIGP